MAVFLLLLVLAFVVSIVTTLLVPIPFIGRLIQRILEPLVARTMLFVLGVFWINAEDKSNAANRNKSDKKALQACAGDAIICNWTSYADVLYLVFRFSPTFVMVPEQGVKEEFLVCSRGFWGVLMDSFTHKRPTATEPIGDVVRRAKGRGQPLVILAEGVRTNGKSVVSMEPFLCGLPDFKGKFHLIAFKHDKHFGGLPFTAGSAVPHMFHVCRQLFSKITVRWLDARCLPTPEDPVEFSKTCRDMIAKYGCSQRNIKGLQITAAEKESFLKFYDTGVKQNKSVKGQGGRAITNEAGRPVAHNMQNGIKGKDAAAERLERLAAKKKKEEEEDVWDSEEEDED
jgi:hypothetical protein